MKQKFMNETKLKCLCVCMWTGKKKIFKNSIKNEWITSHKQVHHQNMDHNNLNLNWINEQK